MSENNGTAVEPVREMLDQKQKFRLWKHLESMRGELGSEAFGRTVDGFVDELRIALALPRLNKKHVQNALRDMDPPVKVRWYRKRSDSAAAKHGVKYRGRLHDLERAVEELTAANGNLMEAVREQAAVCQSLAARLTKVERELEAKHILPPKPLRGGVCT